MTPPSSAKNAYADSIVGWLIAPAFLLLAAWFLFGPTPVLPSTPTAQVDRAAITSDPLRELMPDPPSMTVATFAKKCTECHALFRSDPETPLRLTQHRNIVQAHGLNDRCFNCHDREDRGKLVLPGGKTVPFNDAARVCATCHGPTYRDWEKGMHGRTSGFWDRKQGERIRLTCTQCHDPHAPAFAAMTPLPGPNTLRMGPQETDPHHEVRRHNPLRRWSGGAASLEETH